MPVDRGERSTAAIAPNLLAREFEASAPNQKWAADFTYLWTAEGWLYVAVVMDLYSRRIVGWAMSDRIDAAVTCQALNSGLRQRLPGRTLLHHSDRGSQYASEAFADVLDLHGIECSMSRRGNCWDNACSETLFGSLKVERLHGQRFKSRRQAKDEVVAWLLWYNRTRLHSTLAYTSPMQFEEAWLASQPRQASA